MDIPCSNIPIEADELDSFSPHIETRKVKIIFEDEKDIPIAPIKVDRIKGQMYLFKDEKRVWDGTRWNCEHGKRSEVCVYCKDKNTNKREANRKKISPEDEKNIPVAPTRPGDREKDKLYLFNGEKKVWDGKRWRCEHGRELSRCTLCGGSGICEHEIQRKDCVKCGGSGICEHEIRRRECKKCEGSSFCKHKIRYRFCRECGGSAYCKHDKERRRCKKCKGADICIHEMRREHCSSCDQPKHPQNWCALCLSVNMRMSNYRPYCYECYCRLHSGDGIPKRFRVKEHHLRDELKSRPNLSKCELIFDKRVNGGCSRRRPDVRIECGTHTVISENDENQHKDRSCENKRMMELFGDLGNRPLVMIRFNPDSYTQDDEKFEGCFTPSKNGLIVNEEEWNRRMEILIPIIEKHVSEVPIQEITVIYLFYSDK